MYGNRFLILKKSAGYSLVYTVDSFLNISLVLCCQVSFIWLCKMLVVKRDKIEVNVCTHHGDMLMSKLINRYKNICMVQHEMSSFSLLTDKVTH